jgi:CRP-like cAMP-binding protein
MRRERAGVRRAGAAQLSDTSTGRPALLDLLSGTRLFAGLDAGALELTLAASASRSLSAGSALFRQGEPPAFLFVLVQGQVKDSQVNSSGASLTIRYMGSGDAIGCAAVFRQVPYPATATAIVKSTALAWPAAQITELMERYPRMTANALDLVSSHTEDILRRLQEMATERVTTRVARTLLRLHDQADGQSGHTAAAGAATSLAVSRQDIAEMAGTDLYSVSRALSRWRQQGIVDAKRRSVIVLDRRRLTSLAGEND